MREEQSILRIVDTKSNGREAVEAIKEAYTQGKVQYSLILMDCSMPILDGYQASDQIKNYLKIRSDQLPMIVACTGHIEEEYIDRAWAHQMDEVIAKPISVAILEELLEEMVDFNFTHNN